MGEIDNFLQATATPLLQPGEQVQGFGHLKEAMSRNLLGVPEVIEHWLAIATDRRLLLFRTNAGGGFDQKPKAEARDLKIICYDELTRIHSERRGYGQLMPGGSPDGFGLVTKPELAPLGLSTFAFDIYTVAEGIDGQERFAKSYLPWLAQQVAAGAYPMGPERQAEIQARLAAAQVKQQEREAAARVQSAKQAAWIKLNAPWMVCVALFLAAGFGVLVGTNDMNSAGRTVDMAKERIDRTKRALARWDDRKALCEATSKECPCGDAESYTKYEKKPIAQAEKDGWEVYTSKDDKVKHYCSPKSPYKSALKDDEKYQAEANDKASVALLEVVGAGVGMLLSLGLGLGALRWRKKQRAA